VKRDKYIYTLRDPRTGAIRYVGATINPRKRVNKIWHSPKGLLQIEWIAELKNAGARPIQDIIERVPFEAWEEREQHWISYFSSHCDLVNESTGGAGAKGVKRRTETLEKMRIAQTGKPKQWSDVGRKNRERTQFKKGHELHLTRAKEKEDYRKARVQESWARIPKEERTRRARERNKRMWDSMTAKERSELGKKVAAARTRNHTKEELSEIASRRARKVFERNPDKERARSSNQVRNWWASLTPEDRASYLARRTEALRKAKASKKIGKRRALREMLKARSLSQP
jgi:hypothetical protein